MRHRYIVEQLTGTTFGAVIKDIKLEGLSAETWSEIEALLYEHGVLIFPSQHLSAETQASVALYFGELDGSHSDHSDRARSISNWIDDETVLTDRDPTWLTLTYPTRYWHMDGTFNPIPPKICLLGATSISAGGGQTGFADMCAAYDALTEPTKRKIENLAAYHSNLIGTTRVLPPNNQQVLADFVGDQPIDDHYGLRYRADAPLRPLVKRHPVTGRSILFIGRHAFRVTGFTPEASESFLAELEAAACCAPRVYEHNWEMGDLIVFDNRRLLHRVLPYDEQGPKRELLNCRIVGDEYDDLGLTTRPATQSIGVQQDELMRLRRRFKQISRP